MADELPRRLRLPAVQVPRFPFHKQEGRAHLGPPSTSLASVRPRAFPRTSSRTSALTSTASAPRSACISPCPASPSARGYPEVGLYYDKAAHEEAEHAARFAELLGEVVTDSTKKNLELRVEAENGATAGKVDLATRAKAANLDAIHDTVHEMARDEARHGKAFAGLLKRYFG